MYLWEERNSGIAIKKQGYSENRRVAERSTLLRNGSYDFIFLLAKSLGNQRPSFAAGLEYNLEHY